jgi:diguanylate cyclase (GGDEF)-like protein
MRKNDLVYRYGGDEFVVLVDLFDNDAAIDKVTLKIINSIDQPIRLIDGNHIELFVSAGVAIYPDDASTQQELLNRADKLMYRSKKTNQFEFYDQNGMAV